MKKSVNKFAVEVLAEADAIPKPETISVVKRARRRWRVEILNPSISIDDVFTAHGIVPHLDLRKNLVCG